MLCPKGPSATPLQEGSFTATCSHLWFILLVFSGPVGLSLEILAPKTCLLMSVYVSQLQISNIVPEVPLVQPRLSYCSVYFCYWFNSFYLSESTLCSISGRLLTSIFGAAIHSFISTFTPDIFINAKHKVLRFQIYLVSLYSFCIQLFATNYISCKWHFFQPFHMFYSGTICLIEMMPFQVCVQT